MNDLISIVIPAYNIAKYLPTALESVLAQTYSSMEIIVVNDGSTDDTGAVIDAYAAKDSRIKAIHKENGGVSSARVAGIRAASGDWIGFVDGDDFVEPDMFENLLKNAIESKADISHCGYQMVFPNGRIDMYYNTGRKECMNRQAGVQALLRGEYVEPGLWNKLFKSKIISGFEESGIWDSSIRINEDLLMNYILFDRAETSVYEDIPFYHYVLRPDSATTSKKPALHKVQNPVKVAELILSDAQKDSETYAIAAERYLRVLIGAAQQTDWKEESVQAKRKLRLRLSEFIKLNSVSKKVCLMAFGIAYIQPVYRLIRKVYNQITGIDRKYDLE